MSTTSKSVMVRSLPIIVSAWRGRRSRCDVRRADRLDGEDPDGVAHHTDRYRRFMDRIEIEIRLNRDRAWLLQRLGAMPNDELTSPRTYSEHDPGSRWSFADHFVHTTLIERNWNAMFRRHLAGEQGLQARVRSDGSPQSMDEIMASIHSWTEEWKAEHDGKPFHELVRVGQAVRAETLALLAELSDDDLSSKIPGAPWADGTVGGIMAANADHGRMHYAWAEEDPVSAAVEP